MRTETCTCTRGHVRRVELSPLHIMGPGTYWLAARPGDVYLAGHGFHFYDWDEAVSYASSAPNDHERDEDD